jgi:hypothetical protein
MVLGLMGCCPPFPRMLGASGARLERLELTIAWQYEFLGDGLVHVAQALRCCSPTLKALHIASDADDQLVCDSEAEDYEDQKALLRVEWTELLAGVSACRELQVLKLPAYVEAESLFPPGTAFPRLTHLEIGDDAREHPLGAGGVELWEVMASGGLPALANLWVTLEGREGGMEEVRSRVAPGLEAVAGTLTHLRLGWRCNEVKRGARVGGGGGQAAAAQRTSPLTCRMMAGSTTPLPGAWRAAGGAALSPCCSVSYSLRTPRLSEG